MSKWYEYQTKELLLNGKTHRIFKPINKILSILARDRVILDIGCNAGTVPLLASQNGSKSAIGIDAEENYINHANEVKAKWIEMGLIKDNISFQCGNVLDCIKSLLPNVDIIVFLRVLYHIRSEDAKTEESYLNGITYLFDEIKSSGDKILIMQGNPGRKHLSKQFKNNCGNNLAITENMEKLALDYDFIPFSMKGEIVVAVSKNHSDGEILF